MRTSALATVAAVLLAGAALPAAAQEQPPQSERGPGKATRPEVLPPPKTTAPPPLLAQPAHGPAPDHCHAPHPGIDVLWVERQVPIQVLVPREVITEVKRPALAVVYRDEKRVVNEIVMKKREVVREVPCTHMVPCTETDPHTGECTTVLKPVVEMKLEKDWEFYAVPAQRVEVVKVPYLKQIEEVVPRKTVVLEYKTEFKKEGHPLPVPTTVYPPRWVITPHVCADALIAPPVAAPPAGPPGRPPEIPPERPSERTPEPPGPS
jgi:hypothetical protein